VSKDSLVLKSTLMKKVCQAQGSSDKVTSDKKVSVPSKKTTPNHPNSQAIEAEKSTKAKIPTDDKLKADRIANTPSWMNPDVVDPKDSPTNEQVPSENPTSKLESDVMGELCESMPDKSRDISEEESTQAIDISTQMAPNEKGGIPPKETTSEHPISKDSSKKKPEQDKTIKGTAVPDHKSAVDSQTPPAAAVPTSQTSPPEKSDQAQSTDRSMAPDRTPKAPRISKPAESASPQKSEPEKRYGPEAPRKDNIPSAQSEMMALEEKTSPGLRQRINNKLFASESGAGSPRQKVMMVSIPILIIVLIFAFRQVLSTSPEKSKGATSEDDAPAVKADSGSEIDWKIPEPLPEIMRDPAQFLGQNDTTPIEVPDQPAPIDHTKLIKLGGIMYSQDKSSAIINGRIVSVGDIVSGITVLKINKDSVEFELDDHKWTQKVDD
jgi:hypothetical protein